MCDGKCETVTISKISEQKKKQKQKQKKNERGNDARITVAELNQNTVWSTEGEIAS